MQSDQQNQISFIQSNVCLEFGITLKALLSERRDYGVIPARHIGYWLCRELTGASLPTIARMFLKKDHTTIISGIKNAVSLMERNEYMAESADHIKGLWRSKFLDYSDTRKTDGRIMGAIRQAVTPSPAGKRKTK